VANSASGWTLVTAVLTSGGVVGPFVLLAGVLARGLPGTPAVATAVAGTAAVAAPYVAAIRALGRAA